jgi:hypothetical protein
MKSDRPSDEQAPPISAGLCDRCVHMQQVTSARGSRFYLCRLSFVDARFPRYPRIPVVACEGFTPADEARVTPR